MQRSFTRILLSVGLLSFVPATPIAAQVPSVRIAAWEQSANGTGVVFKPLPPSLVEDDAASLRDATAAGLFEYSVDTADIKWADECRCFRYYTVTVKSLRTGNVSRHKFKAHPSGSFDDQRILVRLTITDATPPKAMDFDDVSLPVASAPGLEPAPLVSVHAREQMAPVSLGGVSEIQLIIRNPSKHTAVQVPSEIVVIPDKTNLWRAESIIESRGYPLVLAPNANEVIRIKVQPNTWQAIQTSIVPTSSERPHTALHVKVPYTNTQFQQRDGVMELDVPIRFRPSIISLAIALVLGVTLGSLVPLVSRKTGSLGRWSRSTGTAVVVAVVLELVAIFMVANNSKFVLFNFDIDPWQTLPVLLLGVSNGLLGIEAARRFKILKDAGI